MNPEEPGEYNYKDTWNNFKKEKYTDNISCNTMYIDTSCITFFNSSISPQYPAFINCQSMKH